MRPKIVIWGAGGHALVVADIIRLRDDYELVGFLDDVNPERAGTRASVTRRFWEAGSRWICFSPEACAS
jgi:PglD N-terminal domain